MELLSDDIEVLCVLKGLIYLDNLWVIQGGEDGIFSDYISWILYILFFDSFDGPHRIRVIFHFGLVDDAE